MALVNHPQQRTTGSRGGFVLARSIFLSSASLVYGWVNGTIFGGGQSVNQIGSAGRQAGRTSSLFISMSMGIDI